MCCYFLILVSHSNYGGSDVPMAPSKEQQTLMWQQNSYLVDSGINSGAATQVNKIPLLKLIYWKT